MAQYSASVEWTADGGFAEGRYSRAHRWIFDGGAVVPASSSPQVVPPPFSDPAGVDPEEGLIASASSCHMLWFLHLARDSGLDVASYRDDASGTVGRDEHGRIGFTRIVLRPLIGFAGREPEADELERLHEQAHDKCFIANSLRCEIAVEPQN